MIKFMRYRALLSGFIREKEVIQNWNYGSGDYSPLPSSSSFFLVITGKKAQYTRNKGLDTELLKSFILKHIDIHGSATRKELEDLILDKMPDYMDEKQRRKRLDNILQNMRDDIIVNIGSRKVSKWIKKKD